MINKQNLWFITLFSLILILGIYYIALPDSALTALSPSNEDNSTVVEVTESDVIVALKVEEEEAILNQMQEAQSVLLNNSSSLEEKNEAYETLQQLNNQKGKTLELESLIKEKYNLDACVKINGNQIKVVLSTKDQGTKYANDIIRLIQSKYETQMYITINFQG